MVAAEHVPLGQAPAPFHDGEPCRRSHRPGHDLDRSRLLERRDGWRRVLLQERRVDKADNRGDALVGKAAARLRKLMAQLVRIARRGKLVPEGFDSIKDARPPKAENKGSYHRWTEEELRAYEEAHPLGTKPRLAFDLLLYGAQRSGNVRVITRATVAGWRIGLDQSKTSNAVDIPVVDPLHLSMTAGPLGLVTPSPASPIPRRASTG